MDARVKKAVLSKIDEAISNAPEVRTIQKSVQVPVESEDDFAFGIAIGRIYNSFHYQTRRILKRDATAAEFSEFLALLSSRAAEIRRAFQ
jgi:hypothetical protein